MAFFFSKNLKKEIKNLKKTKKKPHTDTWHVN